MKNIFGLTLNIILKLRQEYLNFLYLLAYWGNSILMNHPRVHSIDETIDRILTDKASVVRFGEGEINIINGKNISFQSYNADLRNRLIEVIQSNHKGLLICIPCVFKTLNIYNSFAKTFWKENLFKNRAIWLKYCDLDRDYYNSFISRLYMDYEDKRNCKRWFTNIKKVWEGREIITIEGEESRLGVNNDLFDNAREIRRILCPAKNAFEKYEEILSFAKTLGKTYLILIALGPAAKVLAFDLFAEGYRVIDIGHIDVEYEWYLKKASQKIPIEYKAVNEAMNIKGAVSQCTDNKYLEQIIKRII